MHRVLLPAVAMLLGGLVAAAAAPKIGANGGKVEIVDGHPVEMVVTARSLTFHVSDEDGSPLSTKDLKARAIVVTGGKTVIVALTPAAPNTLTGTLAAPLADGDRILLSTKLHGHKLEPRFVK